MQNLVLFWGLQTRWGVFRLWLATKELHNTCNYPFLGGAGHIIETRWTMHGTWLYSPLYSTSTWPSLFQMVVLLVCFVYHQTSPTRFLNTKRGFLSLPECPDGPASSSRPPRDSVVKRTAKFSNLRFCIFLSSNVHIQFELTADGYLRLHISNFEHEKWDIEH